MGADINPEDTSKPVHINQEILNRIQECLLVSQTIYQLQADLTLYLTFRASDYNPALH